MQHLWVLAMVKLFWMNLSAGDGKRLRCERCNTHFPPSLWGAVWGGRRPAWTSGLYPQGHRRGFWSQWQSGVQHHWWRSPESVSSPSRNCTASYLESPLSVSNCDSAHWSDRWVHDFTSGGWAEGEEGCRTGQRNDGLLQHHRDSSRSRHAISQQFGEAFTRKRVSKHVCVAWLWSCVLKQGGSSIFHFCFP